jgi:hypothetical protein
VNAARMPEADRPAQHRCAGEMGLAGFHDNSLVKRAAFVSIVFSEEGSQKHRVAGQRHKSGSLEPIAGGGPRGNRLARRHTPTL